ncbi:unnamed protein product [Pleuronectes platessa]|uniref:Uncharacterized protein n=1 Tax=Pleuronectes platessa TaxID=8262 RepID=A0A9N7YRK9_PLEPL|nr:unnamed protein product [Pleuronectes platessa]
MGRSAADGNHMPAGLTSPSQSLSRGRGYEDKQWRHEAGEESRTERPLPTSPHHPPHHRTLSPPSAARAGPDRRKAAQAAWPFSKPVHFGNRHTQALASLSVAVRFMACTSDTTHRALIRCPLGQ